MNIIIADDHPLVRDSLRGVVKELLPQASIDEAASASEVLSRLDANPDVEMVLLDLVMPGANRFELLEKICAEYPELKVVVLSASESPADIRKTLDVGATGFVPKSAAPAVIISAIRLVIDGGVYVPHELLKADPDGIAQQSLTARGDSPQASITPRQTDVLRLLAIGKSNKEIARELDLSEHTVKIHVASLLRALGVNNRTQAAVAARQQGLLDD